MFMKLEHMQADTHRIRFVRKQGQLRRVVVPHKTHLTPLTHPMFPIERPAHEHTRASSEDS
jgi:hypothetical protein